MEPSTEDKQPKTPADGAPEEAKEQQEASKTPGGANAGSQEEQATKLLDRLKAFFEENGSTLDEGWRIEIKQRTGGSSAGTSDAYYFSPANKRYRSRAEIARDFGFAEDRPRASRGAGKSRLGAKRLTREEAYEKAKERKEATELPLELSNGVTVLSLGRIYLHEGYHDEDEIFPIDYVSQWTDEKGIRFTQNISFSAIGPVFSIKASDTENPSDGPEPVVGAGPSPDEAYHAAAERQQEVMEIALVQQARKHHDEAMEETEEPAMEAGDALLVKAAPLATIWGHERFGLADILVLQAIEGLDKADETEYLFVEQRKGWDDEAKQLAKEAALHGMGKTGRGKASTSRPRPRTQAERDEHTIKKLLDNMIRQIEMNELRANAAEHKAQMKRDKEFQKSLEKEQRRLARERERELARRAAELQREQQRQLWMIEQRRREEAARTFDDETLETASIPLPVPPAISAGQVPIESEPTLIEAWQLVHRFADVLGLERVPLLDELTASVVGADNSKPSYDKEAADKVLMQLIDFLVGDLYHNTVDALNEANPDVTPKDLLKGKAEDHPIVVQPNTWPEVARRLLSLLATTAAVEVKENMAGLAYPLEVLHPLVALQYLTSGPPPQFAQGPAFLPRSATSEAAHGLLSVADAEAITAAEHSCFSVSVDASVKDATTKLLRTLVWQLATLKNDKGTTVGGVLCFNGTRAAPASKLGRPLDLRMIGARVESGVYLCAANPLKAFGADVRYACALYQAATQAKNAQFAVDMAEEGGTEAAALAISFLEAALKEVDKDGVDAYVSVHAPQPETAAAASGDAAEASKDSKDAEENEDIYKAIHDLERPFNPLEGCSGCWSSEKANQMVECTGCSCQYHVYCLTPALEDVPDEDWLCSVCTSKLSMEVDQPTPKPIFAKLSNGEDFLEMAELLATKEYRMLDASHRLKLLQILCTLFADSHALHNQLNDGEEELKEKRKELNNLRIELKKLQQEQAAAEAPKPPGGEQQQQQPQDQQQQPQQQEQPVEEANKPILRSGRSKDPAAEMEEIVRSTSKLDYEVSQYRPHRLHPVGTDRHYNRYWYLPSAACTQIDGPPSLLVERQYNDTLTADPSQQPEQRAAGEWQVGVYRTSADLDVLLRWLNPKGTREKPLVSEVARLKALHEEHAKKVAALEQALERQQLMKEQLEGQQKKEAEDAKMEGGEEDAEAEPEEPKTPVQQLQQALLDYEAGMTANMRNNVWNSEERVEAWKAAVSSAEKPSQFLAALIALERGISADHLKPLWQPWGFPTPLPESAGTLATVWLRLEALKAAETKKLKIKITAKALQALGAGENKRTTRAADQDYTPSARDKRKHWWSSGRMARSGSGAALSEEDTRAERAAKRARARDVGDYGGDDDSNLSSDVDDEVVAQRLNAMLNGTGRARSRLHTVTTAGKPTDDRKRSYGDEEQVNDENDGSEEAASKRSKPDPEEGQEHQAPSEEAAGGDEATTGDAQMQDVAPTE